MKVVAAVLHVDYVDAEMPDVVQTLVWQTYDESPEFPRLVDQINEIGGREGTVIKNWVIKAKVLLAPKPTHQLQTVTAH